MQLYGDYFISHDIRIPSLANQDSMESHKGFLTVAHLLFRSCWKQRKVLQPMRHMRKTTSKNVVWSFVVGSTCLCFWCLFFGGVRCVCGDLKKWGEPLYFRPVNKTGGCVFSCLLDLLSLSIQSNFNYRNSYLKTMCSTIELDDFKCFDKLLLMRTIFAYPLHFHWSILHGTYISLFNPVCFDLMISPKFPVWRVFFRDRFGFLEGFYKTFKGAIFQRPVNQHPESFPYISIFHNIGKRVVCVCFFSSRSWLESGERLMPTLYEIELLGGGFRCFLFSSRKLGKIPILTHIFYKGVETTS